MRWLNNITNSMEMNFSKLQKLVGNRGNQALLQFATVGLLQFIGLQKFKGLICRISKDNCVYTCVVHIYQIHISVCCEVLEAMKPK